MLIALKQDLYMRHEKQWPPISLLVPKSSEPRNCSAKTALNLKSRDHLCYVRFNSKKYVHETINHIHLSCNVASQITI